MTYYIVMTGDGNLLCDGVPEYEIERIAQEWADCIDEIVYYSQNGTNNSDDEDNVTAVKPHSTTD